MRQRAWTRFEVSWTIQETEALAYMHLDETTDFYAHMMCTECKVYDEDNSISHTRDVR
jgi:hypothetical protein